MEKKRKRIILADGTVFTGTGFGSPENKIAEIVFNTSMVGYQEILSDPSYTDQAVVMTYPLIGNYGMCQEDYETITPTISAMIVREYCEAPSNFRCDQTLEDVMIRYKIAGVEGIDTRKLTRRIRDIGSCQVMIADDNVSVEEAVATLKDYVPARDAVSRVSTKQIYNYHEDEASLAISKELGKAADEALKACYKIVAIDCGIKHNILRSMEHKGMDVTVVPFDTSAGTILSYQPDGVFISNGPGDPTDVGATIETIKELIGKVPIFGICLGHQIISLAYGAKTYKLKFGHRGGNHPVKSLLTDKLEITSQNHSYAVDTESIKNTDLTVTHINLLDNTVEGVACPKDYVFSVQYHPESAPGPQDSDYLFDDFIKNIIAFKEEKTHA